MAPVAPVAPVLPTASAAVRLRPLGLDQVHVTGGFWAERLRINRERTIPHGFAQLQAAGTLHNFRLAAGLRGEYRALGRMFDGPFPFLDSDAYKWLEAVGWELGRGDSAELRRDADEAIGLIAAAQRPDGYLNTFVQVLRGGEPYQDLQWGHELYCIGHLIQAGVAWHRGARDDRLLEISVRAADHVYGAFGPAGEHRIEGHPEIEMALVELYRVTGERRYLELARLLIERRGHHTLGYGKFGEDYWQDHLPVREAPTVAGHAVRQLYLDCGAVDVAVETGDDGLLAAVRRRFAEMLESRTYLTGGLGARHTGEAFGEPFELPNERAYAETCASIAGVMLAWRLLLATGESGYADMIERTMLNGVLAALSADGTQFFYVNPLARATDGGGVAKPGDGARAPWFPCACCPPNLMRILSSWEAYLATTDDAGVQVHQFAEAEIDAGVRGGSVRLSVATDYPWSGDVAVDVRETPAEPWTLSLRGPAWSGQEGFSDTRAWYRGDAVELELDMPARVTEADPRIAADRGAAALERGPLVYCVETPDLHGGGPVEDIRLPVGARAAEDARADLGPGIIGLTVVTHGAKDRVGAIPYFAWANRGVDGMRVWIPREEESHA